jgi:hypothetical protein
VSGEEPDLDARVEPTQRPLDEQVAGGERVSRSAEALCALKPDERRALMLKAQGYSYQEIGEHFGWTYTNIKCPVGPRRSAPQESLSAVRVPASASGPTQRLSAARARYESRRAPLVSRGVRHGDSRSSRSAGDGGVVQSVGVGLKTKCYVGGKDIDNRGGGVLDFIVKERGNATLIEIKCPTAPLLGAEYRHDVWPPSRELAGACTQALHYRSNLLHEFYPLAHGESEFRRQTRSASSSSATRSG